MAPRLRLMMLAVLSSMAVGCGESEVGPNEAYDPAQLQGTVDSSLPGPLQSKQQALGRILVSILEGIDIDALSGYHPDVQFRETTEEFLEGAINLARWDFNGSPTGDDVPVVLYLSADSSGRKERRVERVYTVTGSPERRTIQRKP